MKKQVLFVGTHEVNLIFLLHVKYLPPEVIHYNHVFSIQTIKTNLLYVDSRPFLFIHIISNYSMRRNKVKLIETVLFIIIK